MAKTVNSLTGAAKDAYLRRLLASDADIAANGLDGGSDVGRERLAERLQSEITRVWVRTSAVSPAHLPESAPADAAGGAETGEPQSSIAAEAWAAAFDPFTPNVVVVLRLSGREQALAALGQITAADNLKLLAREQQLGIDPALAGVDELRAAILTAAERRIANRRAAAS